MTAEDLFRALGDIYEEKIEEAYVYNIRKEKPSGKRRVFLAFAVCAGIFFIALGYNGFFNTVNESMEKITGQNEKVPPEGHEEIYKAGQYYMVIYDDMEYTYTGEKVEPNNIDGYLAEGYAYGWDEAHILKDTTCRIYSIRGMDTKKSIAVKFEEMYYIYTIERK